MSGITRGSTRGALLLAAVVLGSGPTLAADTKFNPVFGLGAGYTNNLAFTAEGNASDTVATLYGELPVTSDWRSGSLGFNYRAAYIAHDRADNADHWEHRLAFNVGSNGERHDLRFYASFRRTQVQTRARLPGDPEEPADLDPFLTQRTFRDWYGTRLRYRRDAGRRWTWEVAGNAGIRKVEAVEGFPSQPGTGVEDRKLYGATFESFWKYSQTSTAGFELEVRRFDLEQSGDEDTLALALRWSTDVGRQLNITIWAGAFRTEGTTVGLPTDTDITTQGFYGRFSLTRTYRTFSLSFAARHAPSSGGYLRGTSTNTDAALAFRGTRPIYWDWSAFIRATRRDPTDPLRAVRAVGSVGGWVERKLLDPLGVRLGVGYSSQLVDIVNEPDTRVFTGLLSIVWYPLGRVPLGRGAIP